MKGLEEEGGGEGRAPKEHTMVTIDNIGTGGAEIGGKGRERQRT